MEVADVLEKAADLIENVGHVRGRSVEYGEDGLPIGFCALGAIGYATVGIPRPNMTRKDLGERDKKIFDAQMALHRHLTNAPVAFGSYRSVTKWSDHSPTEDVVEGLRQTAKDLRNEGGHL